MHALQPHKKNQNAFCMFCKLSSHYRTKSVERRASHSMAHMTSRNTKTEPRVTELKAPASGSACILPGQLLPHMRGIHHRRACEHCQQNDHGLQTHIPHQSRTMAASQLQGRMATSAVAGHGHCTWVPAPT